jgi:hypothetical protein
MAGSLRISVIFISFLGLFQISCLADPFVDSVVEVHYGSNAGFGQESFPDIVLGPPQGAGMTAGSSDVLSLGDGGSITLEFTDNIVRDGEGPDLIIFENAFYSGGDPLNAFVEAGFVEVSQDGVHFYRFANDYNPAGLPVNNPDNWHGFAGVHPVYSNSEDDTDPTNPDTAGGDAFDLGELGLDTIRFVRIIDTNEPPEAALDDDGDPVYDPGQITELKSGFDLDAIAAVHSEDIPTPTPTPAPPHFDFNLVLSQSIFYAGYQFTLSFNMLNPKPEIIDCTIFIILDVFGEYYFWPSWSPAVDGLDAQIYPGFSESTVLDFAWPSVGGHAEGLAFWGAVLDETGMLLDEIEREEFSYN